VPYTVLLLLDEIQINGEKVYETPTYFLVLVSFGTM
jgi:hypothetical protein